MSNLRDMSFISRPYTEEEFRQMTGKSKVVGEVLLVVDSQVQDSAIYKTDGEKHKLFQQFLVVKDLLLTEHPYSKVSVEYRETI